MAAGWRLQIFIMKKVLVVHYSQTGQLSAAVQALTRPLAEDPQVTLHFERIAPQQDYPYPWPLLRFFDVFPESVYMDPPPMRASSLTGDEDFDLVIIAYQVWFLSPSLPVVGFLNSPQAKKLLANKPVITLIACRNMWLNAHRKMTGLLGQLGARHCDNIVLTDNAPSLATFITTPRWLMTGKKNRFLGLPEAGVCQQDIDDCQRFGRALSVALRQHQEQSGQSLLQGLSAVKVNTSLIASEMAGHRSFLVWGRLIRGVGKPGEFRRKPLLLLYILFLIALIITVVPVTLLVKKLLSPFLAGKLQQQKTLFEQPSGSDTFRMKDFI